MIERPPSVLFGVPAPAPGGLTAGQSWTAALALVVAALLVAFGGGGALVARGPATGLDVAPAAGEPVVRPASPVGASSAPVEPAAPATPLFEPVPVEPQVEADAGPTPPPDSAPPPAPDDPADPGDDGGDGTGDDEPPAVCDTPAAPVLANAGLCPPAEGSEPRRYTARSDLRS